MDAKDFIEFSISKIINISIIDNTNVCSICGSEFNKKSDEYLRVDLCLICSFLTLPNKRLFGMLTANRAHSGSSFLNSMLVFKESVPVSLITTGNYSKKMPNQTKVNVINSNIDDYVLTLLKKPVKCVCIKTSLNIEPISRNIVLSDESIISIISSSGVCNINVFNWNKLILLLRHIDYNKANKILDVFKEHTENIYFNLNNEFVRENAEMFLRISNLIDLLPNSRAYMIKLLKKELSNEA